MRYGTGTKYNVLVLLVRSSTVLNGATGFEYIAMMTVSVDFFSIHRCKTHIRSFFGRRGTEFTLKISVARSYTATTHNNNTHTEEKSESARARERDITFSFLLGLFLLVLLRWLLIPLSHHRHIKGPATHIKSIIIHWYPLVSSRFENGRVEET